MVGVFRLPPRPQIRIPKIAAAFTGRTYYVSGTGSDSNNGLSTGAAWQTVAKVNSTVLRAGDTVLFEAGTTFSGTGLAPTFTGTPDAANPVTFGSYGGGAASITVTSGYGFYLAEVGGVQVRNLTFIGSGSAYTGGAGIGLYRSGAGRATYVRITGCDVSGFKNGIEIGAALAGGGYSDVVIDACVAHQNRDQGILVYGPAWVDGAPAYAHTNVTVTGSTAHTTYGNSSNTTSNSGSGIVLGSVDGGLIQLNEAYSNGQFNGCATEGPVGIWCYNSNAVRVTQNSSHDNLTATVDGGGFDADLNCSNCGFDRNIAYGNAGPGMLLYASASNTDHTGTRVHDNVQWGNGQANGVGELRVGGNVGTAQIFHNTIVATGSTAALQLDDAGMDAVTIRNNILVTDTGDLITAGATLTTADVLLQGNTYWRPGGFSTDWNGTAYTTLAAFRAGVTGQENIPGTGDTGFFRDPQLVDPDTEPAVTEPSDLTAAAGLKLQPASQTTIAGLDLPTLFSTVLGEDFWGNDRDAPYSPGANEASPLAEALVDTFDAYDTNKWPQNYNGTSVVGGRARVACAAGVYAAWQTAFAYTLAGSHASVRTWPQAASTGTEVYTEFIVADPNQPAGTNLDFIIDVVAGTLTMANNVGYADATAVTIAYDPTAHAYRRYDITAGTLTWKTSPDNANWTVRRTMTAPTWVAASTQLAFALQAYRDAGTTDYVEFDDFNVAPPAGVTVSVGRAVETDTASAVARSKSRTLGQTTSTDTAQPITGRRSRTIAVGQAAESSAAQPVAKTKTKAAGRAAETDAATAVVRAKRRTLAQPAEADTAAAIRPMRTRTVGQALEVGTAQPVARRKTKALGQAAEADAAQPISSPGHRIIGVGQAGETSAAQPIRRPQTKLLGRAASAETAAAIRPMRAYGVGRAAEACTAQAARRTKTRTISHAGDFSLAQPVRQPLVRAIDRATETSAARSITPVFSGGGNRPPAALLIASQGDGPLLLASDAGPTLTATSS